jgi:hypothetical protein
MLGRCGNIGAWAPGIDMGRLMRGRERRDKTLSSLSANQQLDAGQGPAHRLIAASE